MGRGERPHGRHLAELPHFGCAGRRYCRAGGTGMDAQCRRLHIAPHSRPPRRGKGCRPPRHRGQWRKYRPRLPQGGVSARDRCRLRYLYLQYPRIFRQFLYQRGYSGLTPQIRFEDRAGFLDRGSGRLCHHDPRRRQVLFCRKGTCQLPPAPACIPQRPRLPSRLYRCFHMAPVQNSPAGGPRRNPLRICQNPVMGTPQDRRFQVGHLQVVYEFQRQRRGEA